MTSCPPDLRDALPKRLRDPITANLGHPDRAVTRCDQYPRLNPYGIPADALWVGWIVTRSLPLGPLAQVQAQFVSRSKLHYPTCRMLSEPSVERAPLGDIAHRPSCSACRGPGIDLTDERLRYLWAVMLIDALTDPHDGLVARSVPLWLRPATTHSEWSNERRDKIAACDLVVEIAARIGLLEPSLGGHVDDIKARTAVTRQEAEHELESGPADGDLPPPDIVAQGTKAVLDWHYPRTRAAVDARPTAVKIAPPRPRGRVIDIPRVRDRARSPQFVTGISHQRVELHRDLERGGRVRADPELVHPEWGASYQWMASKLAEKHPPSAGRALIWGTVTGSVVHSVCDSSCGDGLPACDLFHVYPGHVSLLLQIPDKRTLLSDWTGWDHIVFGGYVPADDADRAAFGAHLLERFGHPDKIPAPP
jgi:hypothetical protein